MKIVTNNVPRLLMDDEQGEYFIYRGSRYDLADFTTTAGLDSIDVWDGYLTVTVWSAVLIKLVDNGDRVIVAYCHW